MKVNWSRCYNLKINDKIEGTMKFYRDENSIFYAESISIKEIIGKLFKSESSSELELIVRDELLNHFGNNFELVPASHIS